MVHFVFGKDTKKKTDTTYKLTAGYEIAAGYGLFRGKLFRSVQPRREEHGFAIGRPL
jgi:hypothetical protein